MPNWLSLLKADPIPYLLAAPAPAVRWWTLRDLLDRPAGDPEMAEAREAARQSQPARTILAAQRASGAWATDRHLYSPKHTATTWQLDILADLGFTAADEPVRRACDLMFAWQLSTGGFGLHAGATVAEPCATARMLCQLHRFGVGADPRTRRAWHWLAATQRADGGWHCRIRAMRAGTNSCFLATIKALEACAAAAETAASGSFQPPDGLQRRAAALVHGCLLSPSVERYASPTLWDRLVYPNHWYDAASVVDALAALGFTTADESMAAAVGFLAALQSEDGTWRQSGELAFRGGTLYDFGHDGQASPWVTLRAARAVKRACGGLTKMGATLSAAGSDARRLGAGLQRTKPRERGSWSRTGGTFMSANLTTLARLASARADLLFSVLGMEEAVLSSVPVGGDWTAKDMLAHVAAWEAWTVGRLNMALSGRAGEMVCVEAETENPRIHAERKDWPLCRTLAELARTHAGLLTALQAADEADLERRYAAPWGKVRPNRWLEMLVEHDQEHIASILAWRKAVGLEERRLGPGCVLLTALSAAREELLAWAALIPPELRDSAAVCGAWTLRDVLGHVTDWELCVLDCLAAKAAGQVAGLAYGEEEEWNTVHAAARQGQSWEVIWADLTAARRRLDDAVSALDDADLVRPTPSVWDPQDTAYAWVRTCVEHDRQHAGGLREHVAGESAGGAA